MELITTRNGKPCLVLDGYQYRIQKQIKTVLRWQCLKEKRDNCKGTLKTDLRYNVLSKTEHICSVNPMEVEVRKVMETCKQRIRDEVSVPVRRIYNEEVAKACDKGFDLAAAIPPYENVKTTLCRQRRITLGTEKPKSNCKDRAEAEVASLENSSNEPPPPTITPTNDTDPYSDSPAPGSSLLLDSIKTEVILPDDYDNHHPSSDTTTVTSAIPAPPQSILVLSTAKKPRVDSPCDTVQTTTDAVAKELHHFNKSGSSEQPSPHSISIATNSEDRFDLFAKNVACKLREMNKTQRILVEKIINDALFEGEMGTLSRTHRLIDVAQRNTETQYNTFLPYTAS